MAVYNTEKYLAEAIESILNQTLKDFELIIINDKSTDNSLRIIKEYMKRDKRIILINNKINSGPAASRNNGLKIAKGKYIAVMDSDDISLPERFKIQYNFLENNKDVFLISSNVLFINELSKIINRKSIVVPSNKIEITLPKRNCIWHPSIIFRNDKNTFYRKKFMYAQDYDLYLNLLTKSKKIVNLNLKLIKYRVHKNSITGSKTLKQELFVEKAKEFYLQRIKYGRDNYYSFNPKSIFNFNIEKCKNFNLLKFVIHSYFVSEDYNNSIRFCKRYIKNKGALNKIGIYYILSILGKNLTPFHRLNRFLLRRFGQIY